MGIFGFGRSVGNNTGLEKPNEGDLTDNDKLLIEYFEKEKYQEIEYDNNLKETREIFGIPNDEKTYYVFKRRTIKKLFSKEIFGIVTRKAIRFIYDGQVCYIPLEDICNYRFRFENKTIHCYDRLNVRTTLYKLATSEDIFKSGNISRDFFDFVHKVQKDWFILCASARKMVKKDEDVILNKYKKIGFYDIIDSEDISRIKDFLIFDVDNVAIKKLDVHTDLLQGDFAEFACGLSDCFDDGMSMSEIENYSVSHFKYYLKEYKKGVLPSQIIDDYFRNSVTDNYLEMFDGDYKKYLKKIFKSYNKLIAYISVTKELAKTPYDLLKENKKVFSPKETEEFLKYATITKNKAMVSKIQEDACENTDVIDGFGFSSVHHIFLSKKEDCIANISADTKDVYADSCDEVLKRDYSYVSWASFLGGAFQKFALERLAQSPEYDSFRDVIKQLTRLKALKIAKEKLLTASINSFRNNIDRIKYNNLEGVSSEELHEKLVQYQEQLENLLCELNCVQEEIKGLKEEIQQTEDDLISAAKADMVSIKDMVNSWKESSDFIDNLIFAILCRKVSYQELVSDSESEDAKIFYFHDTFFCMTQKMFQTIHVSAAQNSEKETSYKGEKETSYRGKKETSNKGEKPYGKHWFSDEAYKDEKVLKKEYRELVKKYHPDCNPSGVKYFIEIQMERASIMELFEK